MCFDRDEGKLLPPAVDGAARQGLLLQSERGLCIAYLVFCCLFNRQLFSDLYILSLLEQPRLEYYPQLREPSEKTVYPLLL